METTYNDCEINYDNFKPSQDIKQLIHSHVESLLMKAPSDAFLKVSVALHNKMFRIDLKLASKVKTIQQYVVGNNILSTMGELQESVSTALRDWKKTRRMGL